jgi:16S rRNA C1402 N4-methylase RsmH
MLFVALRVFRKIRHRQQLAAAQKLYEQQREAEWQRLVGKYGEEIAARIAARNVWQGMTVEQLIESWGSPADIAREIVKARKKETWKYVQTGKNRFANRIYLENGIVIGWKT